MRVRRAGGGKRRGLRRGGGGLGAKGGEEGERRYGVRLGEGVRWVRGQGAEGVRRG